jgi:hypothetical protein
MKTIHAFGWIRVVQWFQQQPKEFFAEGICWLLLPWDTFLSAYGDCFNGLCSFTQDNPQMGFI